MDFVIEKGIEIPPKKIGIWVELADKMQLGDSVVLDLKAARILYTVLKEKGYNSCMRQIENDRVKRRVWKIE